jgi:tRNA 2-thiouridine synthesizing protein A
MEQGVNQELDAQGLICPLPLLKAKQALNRMVANEVLKVLATDAGSVRDFKVFCDQSGHELLSAEEEAGVYIYYLRKRDID